MPHFSYRGRNSRGDLVAGRLEAADSGQVADQLLATGITPVEIGAAAGAEPGAGARLLSGPAVTPMRVDLTAENPAGQAKLRELRWVGIPLLAIYGPATGYESPIMYDSYTAGMVHQAVTTARGPTPAPPPEPGGGDNPPGSPPGPAGGIPARTSDPRRPAARPGASRRCGRPQASTGRFAAGAGPPGGWAV